MEHFCLIETQNKDAVRETTTAPDLFCGPWSLFFVFFYKHFLHFNWAMSKWQMLKTSINSGAVQSFGLNLSKITQTWGKEWQKFTFCWGVLKLISSFVNINVLICVSAKQISSSTSLLVCCTRTSFQTVLLWLEL